MNPNKLVPRWSALLALLTTLNLPPSTFAQGTGFTYQGVLSENGVPATGIYDLRFSIYDALTDGNTIAGPPTNALTAVSNGLFTVTLDFGTAAFMGADRWLDIGVRTNGSADPHAPLEPRQPLTPTPYALHAVNAAGLMSFANAPVDIKVNGERALRLEPTPPNPNSFSGAPNLIGGSEVNSVSAGIVGATIGGGGAADLFGSAAPNLVLGDFGTVGGGAGNTSSNYATVGGGYYNTGSGWSATVGGGIGNISSGYGATVGGGEQNTSSGFYATVGGGINNTSSGYSATVSGGERNTSSGGRFATVGGGLLNGSSGERATVGGGENNTSSGDGATVGGGAGNTSSGPGATVGGGGRNTSSGFVATVGGGGGNTSSGDGATVGGGTGNTSSGHYATVSGGSNNTNTGTFATVGGGLSNTSSGNITAVGGGRFNTSSGFAATVGGGENNTSGGYSATVGGGVANTSSGHGATVGGGTGNTSSGAHSTVAGGGDNTGSNFNATVGGGIGNTSSGENAGVGAGRFNTSSGSSATVGGGELNTSSGNFATVSGGTSNTSSGDSATVGGGYFNIIQTNANGSTIGGGYANIISNNAQYATVPGGYQNVAGGSYSFAAGNQAKANHQGSFVWGDYSAQEIASTNDNSITMRASGGVRLFTDAGATSGVGLDPGSGTWSSLSDRHAKENFTEVNAREILDKVAALPLASWNYKTQDKSIRHLGPMAQDFRAAFFLGESDRTITTVDADGVALAAIQGLNQKLTEELKRLDAKNAELKETVAELKELLGKLAGRQNGGAK